MESETTNAVRTMLAAARLPASEPEIAALTAGYPAMQAGVEALYAPPEVRYLDRRCASAPTRWRRWSTGPGPDPPGLGPT
jgi:hypothetical protein